jgi:hypothetical protein
MLQTLFHNSPDISSYFEANYEKVERRERQA